MNNLKQDKIAVLLGGHSSEREISLMSGEAVLAALKASGYNAEGIDPAEYNLFDLKKDNFTRVFIILHGGDGEDGTIQGVLEYLDLPYTGSGIMASSITMNKVKTKLLWEGAGLPVGKSVIVHKNTIGSIDLKQLTTELGLPLFVKPSSEGSSVGISKVTREQDILAALNEAAQYGDEILVEKYIDGAEYTVPVVGGEVFPSIKIEVSDKFEFYDYQAKYFTDDTKYLCPSLLNEEQEQTIRQLAKQGYDAVGCSGWARVDIMSDSKGNFYLLEVNTVPGMTSHSLVPMSAKSIGYSFERLVEIILENSL